MTIENPVKLVASLIIPVILIVIGILVVSGVRASYEYENKVTAQWSLADKSSTIAAKSEHLDQFVTALESQGLQGSYNAILFKNSNNSFDTNLIALKTLQTRLHEIKTMDPASFQYQQAIAQITAQEQGEAKAMLDQFEGCWYLHYHFFLYDWILICWGLAISIVGIADIALFFISDDF